MSDIIVKFGPDDCDNVKAAVEAEYPGKNFSCVKEYQSSPPTYIVTEVEGGFNEYDSEQDDAYDSGYESDEPR
ncbi:hypothetical protein IW148_001545 [Coemansia sp. RSA 1199]|nr:hypothetical protein IW148_001545 [Coemansia sp. RSA 1199]